MSRGLRWSEEQLTERGWAKPLPRGQASGAAGPQAIPLSPCPTKRHRRAGKQVPPVPYERDVLRAVLAALQAHPRVAWAVRFNSGMAMLPGKGGKPQPVRFGFEGCPDIIGQIGLRPGDGDNPICIPGCFLAVECKRPGKHPTSAQQAFLDRVRAAGGVAFCARGVEEVWQEIGKP